MLLLESAGKMRELLKTEVIGDYFYLLPLLDAEISAVKADGSEPFADCFTEIASEMALDSAK